MMRVLTYCVFTYALFCFSFSSVAEVYYVGSDSDSIERSNKKLKLDKVFTTACIIGMAVIIGKVSTDIYFEVKNRKAHTKAAKEMKAAREKDQEDLANFKGKNALTEVFDEESQQTMIQRGGRKIDPVNDLKTQDLHLPLWIRVKDGHYLFRNELGNITALTDGQ